MSISRLALTALATAVTTNCFADWQYTKWGMSLEQLLLMENVHKTNKKEEKDKSIDTIGRALARTTYVADGVNFTVLFFFDANKLVAVSMSPPTLDEALKINNRLELAYGKPIETMEKTEYGGSCRSIRRKWRAETDVNVVSFDAYFCIKSAPYNGMAFYKVLYQPTLTPKRLGL